MNHTEDFKTRNESKKDYAEDKCKEYFKKKNIKWTQFGFDCRHTFGNEFYKINQTLRSKPDFMVISKGQAVMVECKGFRDELKLKICDIQSYDWWTQFHPLSCFLYHPFTDEYFVVSYKTLSAIALKCEVGRYDDSNKAYHKMPLDVVRSLRF